MSITVKPSPTADTRTCDYTKVTHDILADSSWQHILDVRAALDLFAQLLVRSGEYHDEDKLSDLATFHRDFVTGFRQTEWWDRHRAINRHHLTQDDGVRDDVNLIDVLEFIADCVMAGMARSGSVYPLQLPTQVLEKAFQNTVEMLKREVVVVK